MKRQVRWTERAQKDIARLDRLTRERLTKSVERLAGTGQGDVKRLQGLEIETYRLRVGDWRILFRLEEGALILLVLRAFPRGGAYKP